MQSFANARINRALETGSKKEALATIPAQIEQARPRIRWPIPYWANRDYKSGNWGSQCFPGILSRITLESHGGVNVSVARINLGSRYVFEPGDGSARFEATLLPAPRAKLAFERGAVTDDVQLKNCATTHSVWAGLGINDRAPWRAQ